jgi:hypothetical protein
MSKVLIEKPDLAAGVVPAVFDEIRMLSERIRQRAFEIFEGRHGESGSSAESDWLTAERDFVQPAEVELVETESGFELRVAAEGSIRMKRR